MTCFNVRHSMFFHPMFVNTGYGLHAVIQPLSKRSGLCNPAIHWMYAELPGRGWSGAIRRARTYESMDIHWFEEPMPADNIAGHEHLSGSTSIPIAVGESLYSVGHIREYLHRGAASIVQVDVARIGGITRG